MINWDDLAASDVENEPESLLLILAKALESLETETDELDFPTQEDEDAWVASKIINEVVKLGIPKNAPIGFLKACIDFSRSASLSALFGGNDDDPAPLVKIPPLLVGYFGNSHHVTVEIGL